MDVLTAWGICQTHTFFANPIYSDNDSWEIVNWDVDFHMACVIDPIEHNGSIVWCAELGSFSLDDHMYYHNLNLDMYADTYEELIINIATWLMDTYGNDLLDDYYEIDEEEPLMKENDNGSYSINPNSKSGWKTDEIIKRIRSFEDE